MKRFSFLWLFLALGLNTTALAVEHKVFKGKEYSEMELFKVLSGDKEQEIMNLPEAKTKAKFNEQVIQYIATLDVKYMYCDVRINNMSAMSNDSATIGLLKGSFDFLESMVNGNNEISIEVADLFFIDPTKYFPSEFKDIKLENKYKSWREKALDGITLLSDKGRKTHIDDGYCSLLIEANIISGDVLERRPIAYLKIVRDEDENFQVSEESYGFLAETEISPNSTIKSEVVSRNEGWIEDVFKVSRTINIKNVPKWSWVDSPQFDGIPNNVELLKIAYQDFWTVLNSKDEEQIKEYLALSLDEMAMAKGYEDRESEKVKELWQHFYGRLGYASLASGGYEMLPLDFSDFAVKQSNDGRLVRLVKKGYKIQPPIGYIRADSENASYLHHYFAYINGGFVLVR